MTHIAIVRQKYRPDGGAERFVSRALEALSNAGVKLSLITREWEGPADGAQKAGFELITCDPPVRGRISREKDFASAAQKIFASHDFDLVQSHERIPGCDLYRAGDGVHREWLNIRKRINSPLAGWWHERSAYHRYVLHAEREMFLHPKLKAVICNSGMVKAEIMRHFRLPAHMLHVIYSGVDTERFHPRNRDHRPEIFKQLGIPENALLALFVGSGFERKNPGTLIKALPGAPDTLHAVIVGQDKHLPRYEKLAQRLGVAKRCHFLGMQKQVENLYAAADMFVLPTLYDPFPNVILEAMASGLPVITSTKCGGAELVGDDAGFVCDALDTQSVARAMRALCDTKLREQMAATARRKVEPYTLPAMSQRLIALYNQLLGDKA